MRFYSVHIGFDDGSNPWYRFRMQRSVYSEEMKRWRNDYELKLLKADECKDGNVMLYYQADEKERKRNGRLFG